MNISLIGMMGSGKTTVGEKLARKLNFAFIDTDSLIVDSEKTSINEIFSVKGEEYFRLIETSILSKTLDVDNQVISTGGGIVKNEKNIELLKEKSLVFYLEASSETHYERVKNSKERPLLNTPDIKEKIINLLDERKINYKKADYVVNTEKKSPDNIVEEIIGKINEHSRS